MEPPLLDEAAQLRGWIAEGVHAGRPVLLRARAGLAGASVNLVGQASGLRVVPEDPVPAEGDLAEELAPPAVVEGVLERTAATGGRPLLDPRVVTVVGPGHRVTHHDVVDRVR